MKFIIAKKSTNVYY